MTLLVAVALVLRFAPRRRQPGWSFLVVGSVLVLLSWTALTALLAGALQISADLGNVYGPLTGVVTLLLWVQLTSAAVFLAFAACAELGTRSHLRQTDALSGVRPLSAEAAGADRDVATGR